MANLRQEVMTLTPPFRLESSCPEYARLLAQVWVEAHPGVDAEYREVPYAAEVVPTDPTFVRDTMVTLRQNHFSHDDVDWFLQKTKAPSGVKALIGRNLELVSHAKAALPHMGYFLKTLETGERMKKPVHVVRPCIEVLTYSPDVILPNPVAAYVLNECPQYGPWLESHVDRFYEVLRTA